MSRFEQQYGKWLKSNLENESNHRRRELLGKGLGHGTFEFLRTVWFPPIGNLDHLFPEWEVRDFNNGYRYLDLAYIPGGVKGGIEIQGPRLCVSQGACSGHSHPWNLRNISKVTDRHTRRILHQLVGQQLLDIASGQHRNRTYQLRV
ncbi:hypothetical protein GCM10010912_34870 [Paenibacillus albidus]|uniref:Uncharacterized protein n=1 Tax=Paenibacillus albidus TaxID=2041023 RepID=A0A917CF62_9BACL|nr:hypothetical protein GCM10010912_34870 [Paenibacillus albidus]